DVRVDRAALDGAGADQRDLDHEVVEGAWLQPGQGGHLGAGFDLEHPDRVGLAEHLVDLGVVGRQVGQVKLGVDHVEGVVQGGEHAQAEQVELDQPGGGAVVPVPLQHAAALHAGPFDGADLDDGSVADDHAAGVDAEVAGQGLQGVGVLGDLRGQVVDL